MLATVNTVLYGCNEHKKDNGIAYKKTRIHWWQLLTR